MLEMWTHTTLTSASLFQPQIWDMNSSVVTIKLERYMSISMIWNSRPLKAQEESPRESS